VERISAAIRVLDLFRQQTAAGGHKPLHLLLRRLVRARSQFQKVIAREKGGK
jgi:hypothetical protein